MRNRGYERDLEEPYVQVLGAPSSPRRAGDTASHWISESARDSAHDPLLSPDAQSPLSGAGQHRRHRDRTNALVASWLDHYVPVNVGQQRSLPGAVVVAVSSENERAQSGHSPRRPFDPRRVARVREGDREAGARDPFAFEFGTRKLPASVWNANREVLAVAPETADEWETIASVYARIDDLNWAYRAWDDEDARRDGSSH